MWQDVVNIVSSTFTQRDAIPGTTRGTPIRWTLDLAECPIELIQHTLRLLPPSDIYHFALTARRSYNSALPVLYRAVRLTYENQASLYDKIFRYDPCLAWVRDLQLGTSRPARRKGGLSPEASNGWDILSDGLIFATLPNLRSVDAWDHAAMIGWRTFLHVMSCLPNSMVAFSGRIRWASDVDSAWPETAEHVFPEYRSLKLSVYDSRHNWHNTHNLVPPALSLNFPNLTQLSLTYQDLPAFLLPKSHFTRLSSFHFVVQNSEYSAEPERLDPLACFLSRHISSLTTVCLPACVCTGNHDATQREAFVSIPSRLQQLQCCVHFATMLSKIDENPVISTLGIIPCTLSSYSPQTRLSMANPYGAVRVLTMHMDELYLGFPYPFDDLARAFPNLLTIHLHITLLGVRRFEDVVKHVYQNKEAFFACSHLRYIVLAYDNDTWRALTIVRDPVSGVATLQEASAQENFEPSGAYHIDGFGAVPVDPFVFGL